MKRFVTILLVVVAMATLASAQYSNPAKVVGSMHDLSKSAGTSTTITGATKFTEICAYCHTPHQQVKTTDPWVMASGESPIDTTNNITITPLWNHALSKKQYLVYTSTNNNYMAVDAVDPGLGGTWSVAGVVNSNLCLGCHDGTIGVNTLFKGALVKDATGAVINSRKRVSPAMLFGTTAYDTNTLATIPGHMVGDSSLGLRKEHPVNFSYDDALAANMPLKAKVANTITKRQGMQVGTDFLPLYGATNTVQCGSCHDVHNQESYGYFLRATMDGSALCLGCHGN